MAAVFGIAIVKDEADIIEQTVTRMLAQVDRVLILDNGSTDGTFEILEQLDVTLGRDAEPGYYQSRKMTALAARAAGMGAGWVVNFDADECWYSPFGRIADVLRESSAQVATAALYDHVATCLDPEGAPVDRIGWRRREPAELPKVACRAVVPATILQGNHGADYPARVEDGLLVVRHYPYRSVDQFVSKVRNGAAAYAATDLPEHEGQHWRDYGRLLDNGGPDAIAEVFRTWFWTADPAADPTLIFDPCPR